MGDDRQTDGGCQSSNNSDRGTGGGMKNRVKDPDSMVTAGDCSHLSAIEYCQRIFVSRQRELEVFKAELQMNRKLASRWDNASFLPP